MVMKEEQKNNTKHWFGVIILAIIFGLGSGVAGEILAKNYVLNVITNQILGSSIDLSTSNPRSNVVIRDAKKVIVNQDIKVADVAQSAQESFVSVFKKTSVLTLNSNGVKNNYYQIKRADAYGLVLTSDGWVALNLPGQLVDKDFVHNYVAFTKEAKQYEIDQVFLAQKDVVLIHLKGVNDLKVRVLADKSFLTPGTLLMALDWNNGSWLSTFSNWKDDHALIQSSDTIKDELVLADNLPKEFYNSWFFNLNGDAIAYSDNLGQIHALGYWNKALEHFLRSGKFSYPMLGVNYIDLANLTSTSIEARNKGALIYPDLNKVAIVKNSAAASIDLKVDDIITYIDNVEINKDYSLNEILKRYVPGDKIYLTYLRGNQENSVEVTLK
jgi:hypothetical protein